MKKKTLQEIYNEWLLNGKMSAKMPNDIEKKLSDIIENATEYKEEAEFVADAILEAGWNKRLTDEDKKSQSLFEIQFLPHQPNHFDDDIYSDIYFSDKDWYQMSRRLAHTFGNGAQGNNLWELKRD